MKTELTLLITEIKINITRSKNSAERFLVPRGEIFCGKITSGKITGGKISRSEIASHEEIHALWFTVNKKVIFLVKDL